MGIPLAVYPACTCKHAWTETQNIRTIADVLAQTHPHTHAYKHTHTHTHTHTTQAESDRHGWTLCVTPIDHNHKLANVSDHLWWSSKSSVLPKWARRFRLCFVSLSPTERTGQLQKDSQCPVCFDELRTRMERLDSPGSPLPVTMHYSETHLSDQRGGIYNPRAPVLNGKLKRVLHDCLPCQSSSQRQAETGAVIRRQFPRR